MSAKAREGQGRPRVALLAVFHETNTFSPIVTEHADFAARWYVGEELTESYEGTRTVVGGFLDGGREAGFELVPVFGAFATPSGTVTAAAFAQICETLTEQLAQQKDIDGVLLELHGDLVAEGVSDAEEHIVSLVRETLPAVPIASVFDLHASMSTARLTDVEILVGYRTNPHIDTYERGREAAALLGRILSGAVTPYRAHRGLPVLAAPPAQRTDEEPLRSLWAEADRLQGQRGFLNVTIHGGYAYADKSYAGLGFQATTEEKYAAHAEAAVETLLAMAGRLAGLFRTDFPCAAEAIDDAIAGPRPVAVADTGDNINGGTPGDTTWLLAEALKHPNTTFLTTIADRRGLERLVSAGTGATVELQLGGVASPRSGGALSVSAEVLALGSGTFENQGPMATGAILDMHGAAWIRVRNCDVLVQGTAVQPNDSNMFRSIGIDLDRYDVLLLKGAAALRADWGHRVTRFVDAGTPGETDAVLKRLDYRHARVAWRSSGD